MARRPSTEPDTEYWIELSPTVAEAYFSFHSPRKNQDSRDKTTFTDYKTVTFEGTVCSSDTPKLKPHTPLMIELCETDEESFRGGYLRYRKGKGELWLWVKKDYFLLIYTSIKDGTVKYIRAFGKELYRGSAAIYDVAFSSKLEE